MKELLRRKKKQGTAMLAGAFGLLLALTLIVTLVAAPVVAQPVLPNQFFGEVTIEPCEQFVQPGARVSAEIFDPGLDDWVEVASTLVVLVDSVAWYDFDVPPDTGANGRDGGLPGDEVRFYVEDIFAGAWGDEPGEDGFQYGASDRFDLEVTDDADPTGSILINDGDACTDNPDVTLALDWDDGLWGCGVVSMRFSNDDIDWSDPWKAVAATYGPWALSAGDGVKTVYVEFLDAADNNSNSIGPISDDIKLDTTDPNGTISINGGAATTNSRNVTLDLTWDDFGGCGVVSMQFRNDGEGWSGWEDVAATKEWILTADDGVKTVYVEFLDAADNNSNSDYTISDEIELITAGLSLINEFVSDPGVIQDVEWIELYNPGIEAVDLTDWTIEDGTGIPDALDGLSVPAGGYLVLVQGTDFSFVLDDSGDIIILTDATATEVDRVAYGDWDDGNTADNAPAPGEDESTGRCPNGSDTDVDNVDFVVFATPTPGAENLADPAVTTLSATGVTDVAATLNGDLDDLGCPPPVYVSFVWGITEGGPYPNETTPQAKSTIGTFSALIDGLWPDTTYYFKAKADGSTVYGDERSFTTLEGPPPPAPMYIYLAVDWNTFSVPLSLDTDSNTLGDLVTLAGLNPDTDVSIAYYYYNDGVTQGYSIATKTYVMQPCDAIIIQMNAPATVPIYPNSIATTSAKYVYVGWNLVGSAFLNETGEMPVDDALISLYYIEGELMPWGYNQVLSPAYNQPDWVYTRREFPTPGIVPNMLVGKGYLVSMDNNDGYDGQTETPWLGPWPEP